MTAVSDFSERVHTLFEPDGGVIGAVDRLLGTCGEVGLRLRWRDNRCRVCTLESLRESTEIVMRQSAFRAILARFAALCNEQSPEAASPYKGEGEFAVGGSPPATVRVVFVNRLGEQRLELRRAAATL